MNTYIVKVPIAGHLTFEVKAMSEDEAIEKAKSIPADEGELDWEDVGRFHKGNVCYCPTPWETEAELIR